MTTFITQTLQTLDERLAQANDEIERLSAARAILDGAPAEAPAQQRRKRRNRKLTDRQQQALAVIAETPGITPAGVARALRSSYGYAVVKTLTDVGQIEPCDGGGYRVVA